jgi:exonuclease SbcC
MKILSIRGKNLASLEGEFEIDFTAEPLKSAGIFAITGTTGSGKSTLLDALCLALFDDTPRTNRASENIQIADIKDKTISQKDSRNILRRGTSDGYAEVDFVSLAGEKFRSRWSVRRSRDKVTGALQNSDFKLTNLSANIEEQGRKTELLAKVVKLIGLTFDQFTRAVLLAQGDFATFLKATQKEKAELLEKLTGTEIYSRISAVIYEKTKTAEQELNTIKERIKDIELLSEEEIEIFAAEKQNITQELVLLNKELEILKNKIKWLDDEATLNEGIIQAEKSLANTERSLEEAKPRYDYLVEIDSVQEIRDRFNELKTANKQLSDNNTNLAKQEKTRDANASLLKQVVGKIATSEAELKKHTEDFQAVEPQIKQVRELDVQITGAKTNVKEAEKEFTLVKEKKRKLEKSITATQTSIASAQKIVEQKIAWFEQNKRYAAIIPRTDLIVNLLDDAATANKQKANNEKIFSEGKRLLDSELYEFSELTKEAERLNRLLPAEIASLRAKLEEGVPCPVCGSVHHPASASEGESLEEAKLNKAKNETADKIAALTERIEKRKAEQIRLESIIESYTGQSKEAMNKLGDYLADFPEWEAAFEKGNLQKSLKSFAETWNNNESERTRANEQLATLQTTLQLTREQQIEVENRYAGQESKYKNTKAISENLEARRKELFGGKNADEVEKFYTQKTKELSEALTKLHDEKNKIAASNEKQIGIINQIKQELERLSERCNLLQKTVDEWISAENRNFTIERLTDLLSKDNTWIVAERETLNRLHQNKTIALATLNERRKTLENHSLLENKPMPEENREILQASLTEKQNVSQQKNTRNAEIDVLFVNHQKGKERIALFEKELNEKGALSENWKKLNELFGSADGAKFKVLAQGYTLDALLAYANKHLQELSKRYKIQRIPDTLALQVVDLDMLGEIRTVHSLSGGESFLISLALALGLSSLSSNRMKIESLFIDEGFGSLDIDTLRVAMDALERLQTQGRKIGVISHVAEMTERIGVRIQVERLVNGKSKIKVISA